MRTTTRVAAAALTAAAITMPVAAHAAPTAGRTPNGAAQQAGVTAKGGGTMGWNRTQNAGGAGRPTAAQPRSATETTKGIDVSSYQDIDWAAQYGAGVRFAWVKATEGTYFTDPKFSSHYDGSYQAGMIRGAYHFANPSPAEAPARTQADYFVDHGGGWSADGKTLPGVLDIEFNPYGETCYGLNADQMVGWIGEFLDQYRARTGRDAVIYTNANWWQQCTGDSAAFSDKHPLWIASYTDSAPVTGGWDFWTVWQYTSTPIDQDQFNGSLDRVQALAKG